jgi:5-methylcytosine-specific restriction endonuclease McrA
MGEGLAFPKKKRLRDPKALAFYRQTHRVCEGCGSRRSIDVHHLVSRQMGGDDAAENLLALCAAPCHREWTGVNRTRAEWLAARTRTMTEEAQAKVRAALGVEAEA